MFIALFQLHLIIQSRGKRATSTSTVFVATCIELVTSSLRTSPHEWNPFLGHCNPLFEISGPKIFRSQRAESLFGISIVPRRWRSIDRQLVSR